RGGHGAIVQSRAFPMGRSRVRTGPDGTFRRTVIRTCAAVLAAAGIACAAAPAAEQLRIVPRGVSVFGAHVGGLTFQPARTRVEAALDRPIAIVYRGNVLTVSPSALGVHAGVDDA